MPSPSSRGSRTTSTSISGSTFTQFAVGGIVRQIQDGETGWLVDSSAECADACIEILRDPAEARLRALKGKEYVRRNFLMPRLLRDWLVLFNRLLGNDTAGAEVAVVGAA